MRSFTYIWLCQSVHGILVITIDLRDAMGDRLFLSGSLRREGVRLITIRSYTSDDSLYVQSSFDTKQATELR